MDMIHARMKGAEGINVSINPANIWYVWERVPGKGEEGLPPLAGVQFGPDTEYSGSYIVVEAATLPTEMVPWLAGAFERAPARLIEARRLFTDWQKGPALMDTATFADHMQRILGTESPWEEEAAQPMRDDLINRWPQIRAFLWGFLVAALLAILVHLGTAQQHQHAANRQAINAVDLSWEVCRAAEGMPAKHAAGGGWIRDGLTAADLEKAESSFDEWTWTDKDGHFTKWPGHEDDSSNQDDDSCSTAWRAGTSAAVPEE